MEHPGTPDPAEGGPVLALERLGPDMLATVGGKAANLGELARAGLPVPAGFCLTTRAYLDATASPALADVHRALAATAPDDLAGLAALAAKARALVLDADVPAGIDAAVRAAYAALGTDTAVAVRSSATAEDLPFASFAGQQDTFLNVVGADAVLAAVRRCWASLWTDRAVTYRAVQGIEPSAVSLAVVVQRMVDAAVAGVLFTANPVTGRRHEAVIDASPGLGEAVVSGAVNPDHFVLDGTTGRILERRIGDKGLLIRPLPGGGTERVAQPDAGLAPSLDDAQLAALELLGRRAEVHFGSPQDLEWAIGRDGAVWLTQSRPITTLYPMPDRPPSGPTPRVYLCFSLAQGLTRPLTPMGLAGIRLIASSVAGAAHFPVPVPRDGPAPYAEAGQRIFFDLTPVVRSQTGRAIVPRVFDVMEARSAAVLRNLFADPRFSVDHNLAVAAPAPRRPGGGAGEGPGDADPRPHPARGRRCAGQTGWANSSGPHSRCPPAPPPRSAWTTLSGSLAGTSFPVVPALLPLPALGFALLAVAGKLAGKPGERGAAGSPAGAAQQRDHRNGPGPVVAGCCHPQRPGVGGGVRGSRIARDSPALPGGGPARRRAVRAAGLPGPVRPPRRGGDRRRHAPLV